MLTILHMPASVTHIGNHAFFLSELISLDLPVLVTHIGDFAFFNSKLTSLEVPASVTHLGDGAFSNSKPTSSLGLPLPHQKGTHLEIDRGTPASENRSTVVPSPAPGHRMYSPFVNPSGIIEIAPKEGGFPQFDHQCSVLFLVTVGVNAVNKFLG